MEKLKAKHDHKLTDILKVMIFALFLILPGLIVLPSMLYYGVNEHATAPTEQVEIYEYKQVDFNQKIQQNYSNSYTTTSSEVTYQAPVVTLNITTGWSGNNYALTPNSLEYYTSLIQSHKYYVSYVNQYEGVLIRNGWSGINYNNPSIFTANTNYFLQMVNFPSGTGARVYDFEPILIDLTQMFGEGNEPTLEEFNTWYTNNYYEYTESKIETLEIDTGTTETYTDITSQIQYNWTSLWKQPLFSWTDYTIVKQGIDNFTGVFGITNTSNISNLIAYELIIVAIYIVIDIVLALFKWLTHLIGEK